MLELNFSTPQTHPFEGGHETFCQMTVLKDHPRPVLDPFVDQTNRDWTLPLAQRQRKQSRRPETLIVGKFQQYDRRIGAGSQNKNQRNTTVRVGVRRGQIEWRRLDVLFPQVGQNEILNSRHHFIRPNASNHQHALEF